jgi:acyl-CoA thioesterase I
MQPLRNQRNVMPQNIGCRMTALGFTSRLAAFLLLLSHFALTLAAPIRIVAIGDSNLGAPGVFRGDRYPEQLEAALRAKGYDVSIANEGINGDTTKGVLERLDRDVPPGTQVAIVGIGVNDVSVEHISRQTVGYNLAAIVRRLRARNIEVLLFGIGPMHNPKCCFGKALADATNSLYYRNFQDGVFDDYALHVEREMPTAASARPTAWHLNKAGYAIVVQRTMPLVEELIKRAQGTAAAASPMAGPAAATNR